MKEICIPFNDVAEKESAEVDVRIPGTGQTWSYKVECIELEQNSESSNIAKRIEQIQQHIQSYDKNWELLQIMDTSEDVGYVHLLYRKRS